jgi:hypothetical protein
MEKEAVGRLLLHPRPSILWALRGSLAVTLILIGAFLTFPASLAWWEQRVLMDEERFVSVGNDLLEREAIQDALANRIATEAEARGVQPEASRIIAAALVRGLPDSVIANEALERAHTVLRRVIRDDTVRPDDETIVLDLRPVVESVISDATLEGAGVQLPPDAGQVVLVRGSDLSGAFRFARAFDDAAFYIAVLPLLVFALAVAVAPNRGLALFGIGLAIALTAGLRIFLIERPLASIFTDAALLEPGASAAADESYDLIAATLIQQEWTFVVIGIALVFFGLALAFILRR